MKNGGGALASLVGGIVRYLLDRAYHADLRKAALYSCQWSHFMKRTVLW